MESKRSDIMKKLWILIPFLVSGQTILWSKEDFISHYEYGEMLYDNPRGVSCVQCHGKSGEGRVIVAYKEMNERRELKGADIRQKSLKEMIHSVNSYHQVMPRYYLTNEEIKAIYDYLQSKNRHYLDKEE